MNKNLKIAVLIGIFQLLSLFLFLGSPISSFATTTETLASQSFTHTHSGGACYTYGTRHVNCSGWLTISRDVQGGTGTFCNVCGRMGSWSATTVGAHGGRCPGWDEQYITGCKCGVSSLGYCSLTRTGNSFKFENHLSYASISSYVMYYSLVTPNFNNDTGLLESATISRKSTSGNTVELAMGCCYCVFTVRDSITGATYAGTLIGGTQNEYTWDPQQNPTGFHADHWQDSAGNKKTAKLEAEEIARGTVAAGTYYPAYTENTYTIRVHMNDVMDSAGNAVGDSTAVYPDGYKEYTAKFNEWITIETPPGYANIDESTGDEIPLTGWALDRGGDYLYETLENMSEQNKLISLPSYVAVHGAEGVYLNGKLMNLSIYDGDIIDMYCLWNIYKLHVLLPDGTDCLVRKLYINGVEQKGFYYNLPPGATNKRQYLYFGH